MSSREEVDPYGASGRRSPAPIARFIGRGIGVLVGVGIGFYGMSFYVLRCFSTCPTDPAENAISQILTLSLVGFGLVVVIAAVTLGTRWTSPGAWVITILGALMAIGGIVTVALAPSLQFAGDRTATVMFGIIDVAVGVGIVLVAAWVRRRSEQER